MRFEKTDIAKLKTTMRIEKNFVDNFRTHDVYTKNVACVFFDVETTFRVS